MFDIGAMEILVIAVLAIVVVGPKDLPVMLRKIGSFVSYFKKMSADFQSHVKDTVDEAVNETGMKDMQETFSEATTWGDEDEKRAQKNNEEIMRKSAPRARKKSSKPKTTRAAGSQKTKRTKARKKAS